MAGLLVDLILGFLGVNGVCLILLGGLLVCLLAGFVVSCGICLVFMLVFDLLELVLDLLVMPTCFALDCLFGCLGLLVFR